MCPAPAYGGIYVTPKSWGSPGEVNRIAAESVLSEPSHLSTGRGRTSPLSILSIVDCRPYTVLLSKARLAEYKLSAASRGHGSRGQKIHDHRFC